MMTTGTIKQLPGGSRAVGMADDNATLGHSFTGDEGGTILVEESSGSAFAEATARPLAAIDEERDRVRGPNMLLWLGAGVIAGLAAYEAWARLRAQASRRARYASAFAPDQADPENFAQTRNAGPLAMRDPPSGRWDAVDEASDESFPASDPPGFGPR